MESYISFSIISVFFYTFMILTLLAGKRSRIINSFMCVLGGMLCWTLGSFLMRMEAGPSYILWYYVSLAGILFLPYFYYVFISEFMGVRMGRKSKIPLLLMLLLFAINIPGGIILRWPDLIRKNGGAHFVYKITPWFLLFFVVAGITIIQIFITMYRGCRRHPGYRKQIEPILVGILIIFVGNLALAVPVFSGFPIDIVSGLINAVLMLYALTRRRLFQMRRLASDGVCFGVGVVLTVVLFINLSPYLMSYIRMLLPAASEYHVLIFSFVFLISAWLVTVLWKCLMNNVFIKKEIQQSQELKDFSQSVSRTLRVGEILRNTVNVLKETTNAGRIYICLRDKKSGEYQAVYSNRPLNDLTFSLKADNPVVTWLTRNEDCVVIRDFRSSTAYKSMWESEKHMFSELGIEYCAGLRQNDDLAGIIAISGDGHRNLNHNDLAMLSSVSSVASIAIKNARLYEAAWTEARTDELTGLLNRKYFYEILDEEYEKNKEGSLALILFNIDDFKLYNQLYGNQQGDVALRKVADIIQASVGEQGYVARHSAKEFAVLMPNYDIFSARNLAESIQKQILHMRNDSADYKLKILTVSVGISAAPYAARSAKELLDNADLAVYHVKRSGKNGIEIFDTMLKESLDEENAGKKSDHEHIYQSYESTIYALTAAIDTKDHYTFGHSNNVAYYATSLAKALNYTTEMVEIIRQAALLHDVGKIGIPEHILNKEGKLTDEEYEIMKGHVEASIGIIRHLPSLDYVIPAVIGHHERYDGNGYPRRIAGEDIPASARILCIADSFDAMTSKRCYKELDASGKSSSDHKRRGRKTVRSGYGGGIYPHISGRKDPSCRTGGAETGRKSIKNIKITGLTSYVRPVFVKNMKKALFIISGKAKYIPDLIHIHIQDHGKLINGEFGGVIIVCEFFNRSFQVFYLGYQIVVTEFLLCLFLNGMKDPTADTTTHPGIVFLLWVCLFERRQKGQICLLNEIGQVDFLTVQFSGHLGCLSHVELCQCTFGSSVSLCKGMKEGRKIIRIKSFRGKAFHIVIEISLFFGSKSSTGTRKLFLVAGFG